MAYTKTTWIDEVLAGAERFEVLDNAGAAVDAFGDFAQCQITLKTAITTAGTPVNASNLNNMETGIEANDTRSLANEADIAALEADVLALAKRSVSLIVFPDNIDVTTGDGTSPILIPFDLNGYELDDAIAGVDEQGVTGTTDVQIRRRRGAAEVDMLSTKITVGAEYYARDGVINTSNDDIATGDKIYVDVDAVHSGTAPKGLTVTLTFKLVALP